MAFAVRQQIELWSTRQGLRCTITTEAAGPPFEVAIAERQIVVSRQTFDTHRAIEFAINAMHEAWPGPSDITDALNAS